MAGSSGPTPPFHRMSADVIREALADVLCEVDEYESSLPCVLICTDRATGEQSFSGPIPTRAAGELIRRNELVSAGADSTLDFALEPLYPAVSPVADHLDG
ncbi:hypothetical protein GCM10022237_36560 [Nocardioides ginsengisoli]|uniref:Uncharacterized protein n=1 Tax=Nocardioides ginsengisoli TaxID=363868 RepID=A0ABW3VUK8_9ACTN